MRYTLSFLVILLSISNLHSQDYGDYLSNALQEYNVYKENAIAEYEAYRARVNAEFAEFMARPWKEEKRHPPLEAPRKEPDIPPVVMPDNDIVDTPEDNELDVVDINPVIDEVPPVSIVPIEYVPKPKEKSIDFALYGTKCSVRFDSEKRMSMNGITEHDASRYWKHLSSGDYDNVLADCLSTRSELDLCDWSYYKLLCAASRAIYPDDNEAEMLCAWLMSQSGFKIRLGRSNDKIILLVNTCEDICGYPYFTLGVNKFYILNAAHNDDTRMNVFDGEYPEEKSLRLSLTGSNRLDSRPSEKRVLKSKKYENVTIAADANLNLLDLYSEYPKVFKDNDTKTLWAIYANAPTSKEMRENVYPLLESGIAGKSESESANMLLNFVQTALEYKTDEEVWGDERAFFPDETLYYPYCDCEDRSILYSRLVRDLMGLRVVLLYYPGHLATAVEFNENIPGDYIVLNGHRYLVCDPTYINAEIGNTMPGIDNSKVSVIMLQ
ncbi:MAG: hypothetical protein MJY77_00360 [Bacteroidaceae bacterium]|nr:hypothetical protein [Bacteroidaceae bacterium]